jgi:hypothetical protein
MCEGAIVQIGAGAIH